MISLKDLWTKTLEMISGMFYPDIKKCVFCGKLYSESPCAECSEQLEGLRTENENAVFMYAGIAEKAVKELKFHAKGRYAAAMAGYMAEKVDLSEYDAVVPVPLSTLRLIMRGYNQSMLIAKKLSPEKTVNALIRSRYTLKQTSLTAKERQENVSGAFEISKKHVKDIKGRKVLLIDDVYTTGSTCTECKKALLKAGAAEVRILTFCKVTA